jgi:hypothetical protein
MVYRCKVCEREPELKKEWASFLERQELSRHVPGTLAAQELCQKFVKYRQDLASLRTHLHQFSTQRRCLQQIEDDLPDKSREQWKVLVYEDFYSQYSEKPQNIGNKVNTLAFTIKWKGEDKQDKKLFMDFICSDKSNGADSYFVIQVWNILLQVNKEEHELSKTTLSEADRKSKMDDIEKRLSTGELIGVLRGVTHIVRSGDSGPHFHSRVNYHWESSVWHTHGIIWQTHTLCKRHAYNECDAHGGSVQRAAHAAGVKGSPPGDEIEYANLINTYPSGLYNAKAYALKNIDRSAQKENKKKIRNMAGMKKMCEFQYVFCDEDGREQRLPGIVLMRLTSSGGKYQVRDLLKQNCLNCSYTLQRPVYHTRKGCPLKRHRPGEMQGQGGEESVVSPAAGFDRRNA